ncbi:NYN domain-containing protein [Pseudactinotalea sp. Z1732]|uniref:NYN domain-containing protein n=1 Tax=Micrococcales TaxID=85006 RepID=UPI003C7CA010
MVQTESDDTRRTYLLVDGENIDATLGMSVLGHRPNPDQRPRWDRITEFAQRTWSQPVTALFFLNATSGQLPMSFIQALLAMGYQPIPLSGSPDESVVDIGIQRTLEALGPRIGDVMLASHDGDFVPQVQRLATDGRRLAVLGFREFISARLAEIPGVTVYDLEDHIKAFTEPLPRVRVIPLESFDPTRYL